MILFNHILLLLFLVLYSYKTITWTLKVKKSGVEDSELNEQTTQGVYKTEFNSKASFDESVVNYS